MSTSFYQYIADDDTVYKVSLDDAMALAADFDAALGSEGMLPDTLTMRYVRAHATLAGRNITIAIPVKVPEDLPALVGQTIYISNQPYIITSRHGESDAGNLLLVGPTGLTGATGSAGSNGAAGTNGTNGTNGADADTLIVTRNLSSAELLAIRATPINLVAAPGVGKMLVVMATTARKKWNSVQYATGGNLTLQVAGGQPTVTLITTAGMQSNSNFLSDTPGFNVSGGNTWENAALQVANVGATEYTTGNSTVQINCRYRVVDLNAIG